MSTYDTTDSLPDKFFELLDRNTNHFQKKFERQTKRYLRRLAKEENKIVKKHLNKDSSAAAIFKDSRLFYEKLQQHLKAGESRRSIADKLFPTGLDSITNTLQFFLDRTPITEKKEMLNGSLERLRHLQSNIDAAGGIQKLLQSRQDLLQNALRSKGIPNTITKYKKEVFYYREQVNSYREKLRDPEQLGEKAIKTALSLPAVQDFISKNTKFGGLVPSNSSGSGTTPTIVPVVGFQTRAELIQQLPQRFGDNFNVQQTVKQNIGNGEGKSSLSLTRQVAGDFNGQVDNTDGVIKVPNFEPNSQRTKSFWKRLEAGNNLQTVKNNSYFPITTDIGLSLGYKVNDRNVLGVGVAGKIGWGQNWKKINLTSEGIGLRSFWKREVKGGFGITAGVELNYFKKVEALSVFKNYSRWNRSALVGISKKYAVNRKLKGNIEVLYDFLSRQHAPPTSPILFRVGYSFN